MDLKTPIVSSQRVEYDSPEIDIITIDTDSCILEGSPVGDGGGDNPDPGGWN